MKHGKMSELERMLSNKSKSGEEMSEEQLQVKMEMLKELMDHAKKGMGDRVLGGLEGLKKVTVASPSQEGLEEGLEKAQELLQSKESPLMEEESEEEMEESSDPSPAEMESKEKEGPKAEEEDEEDYSPFIKRRKK